MQAKYEWTTEIIQLECQLKRIVHWYRLCLHLNIVLINEFDFTELAESAKIGLSANWNMNQMSTWRRIKKREEKTHENKELKGTTVRSHSHTNVRNSMKFDKDDKDDKSKRNKIVYVKSIWKFIVLIPIKQLLNNVCYVLSGWLGWSQTKSKYLNNQ